MLFIKIPHTILEEWIRNNIDFLFYKRFYNFKTLNCSKMETIFEQFYSQYARRKWKFKNTKH